MNEQANTITIAKGKSLEVLKHYEDNSVDAVVTDPPYGLKFMGKKWDYDVPSVELWKEAFRVMKPGAFLLSFAGSRTYHRMAVNIEDAGFEIRDQIMWIYGSGFPKSHNIGKAIDKLNGRDTKLYNEIGLYIKENRLKNGYTLRQVNKFCNRKSIAGLWESQTIKWTRLPSKKDWDILKDKLFLDDRYDNIIRRIEAEREIIGEREVGYVSNNGAFNENSCGFKKGKINITIPATERAKQWEGWGTALKPAHEPIVVARKPLSEKTVALNVLKWGTGGINIDDCRIGMSEEDKDKTKNNWKPENGHDSTKTIYETGIKELDTNQHNQGRFPANIILDEEAGKILDEQSGISKSIKSQRGEVKNNNIFGEYNLKSTERGHSDKGGASRFFYCAKASKSERNLGCEEIEPKLRSENNKIMGDPGSFKTGSGNERNGLNKNNHPTVKPIKLMEYLIKLVSKEGAVVLDPFLGSGTTLLACQRLNRKGIGIEMEEDYIKISQARLNNFAFSMLHEEVKK